MIFNSTEKIMIRTFNQLLLLFVVVVFFGCSGSSKDIKLCEGDLKECSSNEDCDCWKNG